MPASIIGGCTSVPFHFLLSLSAVLFHLASSIKIEVSVLKHTNFWNTLFHLQHSSHSVGNLENCTVCLLDQPCLHRLLGVQNAAADQKGKLWTYQYHRKLLVFKVLNGSTSYNFYTSFLLSGQRGQNKVPRKKELIYLLCIVVSNRLLKGNV